MDKYQFLQSKIGQIEHELNEIKRLMNQSLGYIQSDPESSLAKSRTILEKVLIDMYSREMSKEPQGLTIEKIIGETQFANKIQRNIVSRIRLIQNMGNIGVHHDFVTTEDALDTLDNVCTVLMWYLERYDLLVKREKPDTKAVEKLYKKAQEIHNQEKYSEALGVWDEIIQQVPEYWDARAERGYTLIKLERKNEAKEETLFILKQEQTNHHALTCLGWILLEEKDYENAIQQLNKAIQNNSNFTRSYNLRGNCYNNIQQYEAAIADYSKALEIDPKYELAWYNRGNTKKNLGQYEAAITDYSKALEIDPKNVDAWNGQGVAKTNLGQHEAAIADYSKALEIDPKYVLVWNNRGLAKYNLGQYEAAIADYSKVLEIDPKDVDVWNNRGRAKYNLGQYEAAIADFSKALEIDPKFVNAWSGRGTAKDDLGQYESAIADYSKALEIDPKYVQAWHNRGIVKKNLGKYEAAIADYSKALEIDPKYANSLYGRGIAKHNLGQYESAIADFSKTISLDTGIRFKYKHYWRAKAIIDLWKPKIDNNGNPKEVLGHNQQIEELRALRAEAVKNQQYERAADLRDRESKLMRQAGKVDWNEQIAMCKEDLKKSQQLDLDASTLKEVNELLVQVNKYKHPL